MRYLGINYRYYIDALLKFTFNFIISVDSSISFYHNESVAIAQKMTIIIYVTYKSVYKIIKHLLFTSRFHMKFVKIKCIKLSLLNVIKKEKNYILVNIKVS